MNIRLGRDLPRYEVGTGIMKPPLDSPEYKATALRHPKQSPVLLPHARSHLGASTRLIERVLAEWKEGPQ